MDHCTILNILLDNPEELDLKHKPSAIREDKIFTLDQRVIPIASTEADDNGAYISKGNAKRYYQGMQQYLWVSYSPFGKWGVLCQ